MFRTKNPYTALQPLSDEHYHGLLLCWKIGTGLKKNIEPERIKRYTDWFFINHIRHHIETEENLIFPILGMDHVLIKQALTQHRRLTRLFLAINNVEEYLKLIEEELEHHIRFEELVLLKKIQSIATQEQLDRIIINHNPDDFQENSSDMFWT